MRPWEGPDVGLYSDMRDVRAWLEPHWDGRRVLNLFAYTGMFSVAAARHGATEVHTVDLAAPCLDRARANFERNGLPTDAHIFDQADALRALDARRRKGETLTSVAEYLGVPRSTLSYALQKTEREIERAPETRGRPAALTAMQVHCVALWGGTQPSKGDIQFCSDDILGHQLENAK